MSAFKENLDGQQGGSGADAGVGNIEGRPVVGSAPVRFNKIDDVALFGAIRQIANDAGKQ